MPVIEMGWKVVRHQQALDMHPRDSRRSAIIKDAYVYYEPNVWADPCPGTGPLCLFGLEHHARDFIRFNQHQRPWWAVRPIRFELWHCCYIQSQESHVYVGTERSAHRHELPYGTILASCIRLMTQVYPRQKGKARL